MFDRKFPRPPTPAPPPTQPGADFKEIKISTPATHSSHPFAKPQPQLQGEGSSKQVLGDADADSPTDGLLYHSPRPSDLPKTVRTPVTEGSNEAVTTHDTHGKLGEGDQRTIEEKRGCMASVKAWWKFYTHPHHRPTLLGGDSDTPEIRARLEAGERFT